MPAFKRLTLPDLYAENQKVADLIDDLDIRHSDVVSGVSKLGWDFTEASVRRLRKRLSEMRADQDPDVAKVTKIQGSIDVDGEGATVNNIVVDSPILDDWGPVFELFNLNPNEFEVVDDTVRMSTWQQSKGAEDGTRDSIQLYSYSARFRRVNKEMISPEIVERWRAGLLSSIPIFKRRLHPSMAGEPLTYLVLVADPQLGKKNTTEAEANWRRGVTEHAHKIVQLLELGHRIERIHIAFQGDETENCMGNYANQPATIELNRSQQLELDYDLTVWTIKHLAAIGLPISVSSVISNHGEWTRWALSKDTVTSRNDNASTYIRRQVMRLFSELEPFGGPMIDWYIGDDTPGVTVSLSGVDCYFSHGYVEKGKGATTEARMQNAIERQILGDTDRHGKTPLWFMAHYHHFYTNEFQERTLFGCPALEAEKSSEYMRDQYGVWSKAGMLGLLVGTHTSRRYSDINIY